jgi:hypothetical protein
MKKLFAASLLMLTSTAAVAVLPAQTASSVRGLKYTTHTEIKPSATPGPAPNPMFATVGDAMMKQMLPSGPTDVVTIVCDFGSRSEYVKGSMGQAGEGSIALNLPNGDTVLLNPKDKTYWKMSAKDMTDALAPMEQMGMKPKTTTKKTGEFATIAGLRAERTSFEWRMDIPIPDELRAQLPPDFPTSLSMAGSAWLAADKYQDYVAKASHSKAMDSLAMLGLDQLAGGGGGLLMKMVMEGAMFGGNQMEAVVTQVGEETIPASLFAIPAEYKEVPSPMAKIK